MGGLSGELLAVLQTSVSGAAGSFGIEHATPVAGGCIHRCFVLEGGGRRYFAKTNDSSTLDSFAAEADGLAALAAAGARVPAPLCRGHASEHAFLVLEHLELRGNGDYAALGRSLAAVRPTGGETFGWQRDNYIGRTVQLNRRSASWSDFCRETRLGPQLELARKNRLGRDLVGKGERLAEALPRLLSRHAPAASLLHGDLWSGNSGFLADGTPVLFDHDVGPAHKLSVDVELGDGGPIGVFLDALTDFRLLEHVDRKDMLDPAGLQDLHGVGGEAALRKLRGPFHIEYDRISGHLLLDAFLRVHVYFPNT